MKFTQEDKSFSMLFLSVYGFIILGLPALLQLEHRFPYWTEVLGMAFIMSPAMLATLIPYILVTRFSK